MPVVATCNRSVEAWSVHGCYTQRARHRFSPASVICLSYVTAVGAGVYVYCVIAREWGDLVRLIGVLTVRGQAHWAYKDSSAKVAPLSGPPAKIGQVVRARWQSVGLLGIALE